MMKKRSFKCGVLLILAMGIFYTPVLANQMQSSIANAGINLGCLASWIERYGVLPENLTMINGWINTVSQELTTIISLYQKPFNPEGVRRIARSLMNFNQQTARWNNRQRGGFFRNLYSRLKQQLSNVYQSTRGIYYSATCDSFILDFGYNFGRAWIGAWIGDRYLQSGGRSGMNLAISEGIKCSNTLGCSFPYQNTWNSLQLRNVDTQQEFRNIFGDVLRIITSFRGVTSSQFIIPSTLGTNRPPPSSGSLEGKWRSSATNDVICFERQGNLFIGYMAVIGRSRLFRVGEMMGEYKKTGNNLYKGKVRVKNSDGSTSWLEGVTIRVNGNSAKVNTPWWNAEITYTRER